jgi:hypothetical protein
MGNTNSIYVIGSCFVYQVNAPCVAVVSIECQQYWITACEFHTVDEVVETFTKYIAIYPRQMVEK